MAKPIPEGYHSITPYLVVKDAAQAIEFYRRAFGAQEIERIPGPGGRGVMHAEIKIGDSPFMITDEFPEFPEWRGPQARGGTPVHIYLYVDDADRLFRQAIAAGAKELLPIQDQWYGDRSGGITDPFGHVWYIATHKEDLTPEELKQRAAAQGKG